MANTFHDQLAGSDLHENKVNATTGTELTPASQAAYDLRWALRSRLLATTAPLTGGGDLSVNRTISLPVATGSQHGYLASTDWTTFNNKAFKVEKVLGPSLRSHCTALDRASDLASALTCTRLCNDF